MSLLCSHLALHHHVLTAVVSNVTSDALSRTSSSTHYTHTHTHTHGIQMAHALQVLRLHLSELARLFALCDEFCERSISNVRSRLLHSHHVTGGAALGQSAAVPG
eukprot:Opistho-2@75471